MIHFFPTFSRDAADTPYGEGLRRLGIPHRIIAGEVRFQYRTRLKLLLVCIPRLALFAVRAAITSLVVSRPRPDTVVLGSDIEVLVFAVVRALTFRRGVRIVLASFIYTRRGNARVDALRLAYFRMVLAATDMVVVHSRLEAEEYSRLFPGVRFVFVPWGGSINRRAELLQRPSPPMAYLLAAGKSGRDYATLFAAMEGVDAELRVICDYAGALPPVPEGSRIAILSDCHGWDYMQQLAGATIVVVPLAVGDISAGQMVLIQAMGLARPVVATRTPTIADYAEDGQTAVLVPLGDVAALRAAIMTLLGDAALRDRLGRAALDHYETDLDTPGHLKRLVEAIGAEGGGTVA